MDIAEVIEETRKLKRMLGSANVGLTPDDIFDKPFLDLRHIDDLRVKVEKYVSSKAEPCAEVSDILARMNRLVACLSGSLPRPSDDELCVRYSSGELDARTVLHITGWSVDELYDNCVGRGLPTAV